MEHKFYTDNFERLLKEKSDEFRMYPSKRVWHSIYNDLHPDRKWPSIAVSLVLVTILFLIGYWNNHLTTTTSVTDQQSALATAASQAKKDIAGNLPLYNTTNSDAGKTGATTGASEPAPAAQDNIEPGTSAGSQAAGLKSFNKNNSSTRAFARSYNQAKHVTKTTSTAASVAGDGMVEGVAANQQTKNTETTSYLVTGNHTDHPATGTANAFSEGRFSPVGKAAISGTATGNIAAQINSFTAVGLPDEEQLTEATANAGNAPLLPQAIKAEAVSARDQFTPDAGGQQLAPKPAAAKKQAASGQLTQEDKSWIEHYALYNKQTKKWWQGRLSSEIYFTPGAAFRKMTPNTDYALAYASITNNITSPGNNAGLDQLNYNPGLTFEAGAGVSYAIAKNIRLKTGIQFNFNNYSINVAEINHPVLTTLLLTDISTGSTYQEGRRSSLANLPGYNKQRVHNQSSQISLPVGVAVKLKSTPRIDWYAGAAIQPTYVIGGKANLISFDHKNYVSDPGMIRSWNLNSSVETYIHYKLDGFTLQAGPQLRYQMMSTYSKKYTYSESLYNIGMKIGLVKNF